MTYIKFSLICLQLYEVKFIILGAIVHTFRAGAKKYWNLEFGDMGSNFLLRVVIEYRLCQAINVYNIKDFK